MPFAADMTVSYKKIEGGVTISDDEYERGREHLIKGGVIKVYDGKMILTSKPEKREGHLEPETEPTQADLDAEKAKSEHSWVKSELDAVTVELMYHWTGDHRASHTEQTWKDYAIALRNYTTTDEEGNPQVVGESRPNIDNYL